ncbi:hypothetical protein BV20DRAFT_408325 [Pilatotrama ljubarskyi]|nr:hypothetical protein BV20DRAFT_408325 [Pilatotrama ljubarskyi]
MSWDDQRSPSRSIRWPFPPPDHALARSQASSACGMCAARLSIAYHCSCSHALFRSVSLPLRLSPPRPIVHACFSACAAAFERPSPSVAQALWPALASDNSGLPVTSGSSVHNRRCCGRSPCVHTGGGAPLGQCGQAQTVTIGFPEVFLSHMMVQCPITPWCLATGFRKGRPSSLWHCGLHSCDAYGIRTFICRHSPVIVDITMATFSLEARPHYRTSHHIHALMTTEPTPPVQWRAAAAFGRPESPRIPNAKMYFLPHRRAGGIARTL